MGPFGLTGLSGGINGDRTKMDSDFASVNEQSGLFGGNKGVEIDVEGNSHIKAGIIASEGKNNSFSTGTHSFEDIQNKADFDVSSSGMSLSGNLNFGQAAQDEGKGGFSTPGASQSHHSGKADSTTQATIGNNVDITIKDEANQTQDIATLNRDTNNAHQSLDNIFDKDKEQARLDEQKLIADIGNQLSTIVRTEGQIRAENAKNDKTALEQAERELLAEGKTPSKEDIQQRAENNAMRDWGTGGKYQQITQAITGALQGVFNGDLTQALANGSAPFLAEAIKNATTNPDGSVNTEANLAAHAILGALLSQANGNSAVAGGLGALTAEAAAKLIKDQIYGDKSFENLTESERQNISALAQIAAAVAGGLAGDSSSDAAQGAIAGKNAVENNFLTLDRADYFAEKLSNCTTSQCQIDIGNEMAAESIKNIEGLKACVNEGNLACAQQWIVAMETEMEAYQKLKLVDMTLSENYEDLANYYLEIASQFTGDEDWSSLNSKVSDKGLFLNIFYAAVGGKFMKNPGSFVSKDALIVGGISAGANLGFQSQNGNEINYNDVAFAGLTGGITATSGFWSTIGWNMLSGGASSALKDEDPFSGAISGGVGAAGGYVIGNFIRSPLNNYMNPNYKNYETNPLDLGISAFWKPSIQPNILGNLGGSTGSEFITNWFSNEVPTLQKDK